MLTLKPRLPVLNETTGKPEWPNLPAGERPFFMEIMMKLFCMQIKGIILHGSNDSYHLKPKGEGASIMVSGVSVPCYGWLGLELIEPKTDGTWNHDSIMQDVHKVLDQFEAQFPGYQLLLTYDNAPSHLAIRKGALSTSYINKYDGGAQPIMTQIGWFLKPDPVSGTVRVQQQMWYMGPDGAPIAKGALTLCRERGLKE